MSIRLRLAGAALLAVLAFASPAAAAEYSAAYLTECCYATLESGEVAGGQYFEFRNTGTATWTNADFKLGLSQPQSRDSVFWHPSWIAPNRPAMVNEQAVAPGQTGRFNFTVQAPSVGVKTTFRENFEPLREGYAWTGSVVYLDYTVLPSLPPSVGFASVPAQVTRGGTLEVTAEATDNRAVDRVEFTVGTRTVSVATPESGGHYYKAQIPTADLADGPQTVLARAIDRVGNFATSTATFSIASPLANTDRDGDGVLASADCDDTNSSIHPGAPEVPGNGVDDDCAGGDAPGTVAATVQSQWTATKRSTRITTLKARNVPAGATIEIRCTGGGCPFKLKRLAVAKAGDVDLRKRYFKQTKLRVGAVLEVRILAPNRIAKVARFTMRARKTPRSSYLCLPPGAKKAAACS